MKSEMLKIAGVKSEKEFYKKYPTEAAFKKAHPKAFKKAEMGASMVKKQLEQLTDFGNPPQYADGGGIFDIAKMLGGFATPGKAATATSAATPASGGLGDVVGNLFGGKGGAKGIMDAGKSMFTGEGGVMGGLKQLGTKGGLATAGKAAGLGMLNSASDILNGVGQMKEQQKAIKKADQASQLSGVVAQAAESRPEKVKNQYVRPEDQPAMGAMNPQGTGSNFLAAYGASIGGNPTEIQNMYNPGDLYSDLGYEPLDNSNAKQFAHGGYLPTAEFGDYFQDSGQASIGKGVGSAVGSIFGPLGSKVGGMLGTVAGNLLGGADDANQLANFQDTTRKNTERSAVQQTAQSIQSANASFMKDGGSVVDYMKDKGMNSSFESRKKLYKNIFGESFNGKADQNLKLLNALSSDVKDSPFQKPSTASSKKETPTKKQTVKDTIVAQNVTTPFTNPNYPTAPVQRGLESGVIVDKNTNEAYVIKGNKVVKQFPVLTGQSRDGENKNNRGVNYLESHPEQRVTPTGTYNMRPKKDIYGEPGYNLDPIPAFGYPAAEARNVAMHVTYPGDFAKRNPMYSLPGEQRTASYGCPNCRKPDINSLTNQYFPQGDTTMIIDSRNQMDKNIISNLKKYEDGGWMNPEYNPQMIAKFGDYSMKQLLQPPHDADMLRAGGHLKEYTPPSAAAMQTYEDGGYMAMGGDLQVHRGKAEPISYNPFLPDGGETVMFKGPSHDNGGMPISYGQNGVEVEGGEPAVKLADGGSPDGNLVVFGNMKIDDMAANHIGVEAAKGKKYKRFIDDLSKFESRQNKVAEKGTELVNSANTNDPFEQLSMNAGRAMMMGSNAKLLNAAIIKQRAAGVQNAILDTAKEYGVKSDELSQGKFVQDKDSDMAKFGAKMETAADGTLLDFLKTSGQKIDFSSRKAMAKELGITNYTGTAKQNTDLLGKLQSKSSETSQTSQPGNYATDYNLPSGFTPGVSQLPQGMGGLKNNYAQALQQAYPQKDTQPAIDVPFQPGYELPKIMSGYDKNMNYFDPSGNLVDQSGALPGAFSADQIATGQDKFDWKGLAGSIMSNAMPLLRPTDQEELDPSQLYPEMFALASNQLEPVRAQQFQPMLKEAYNISLQDQLNEVDSQVRAVTRQLGDNPAAAAQIFASAADAKNKIRGEQMRINQAQQTGIRNENIAALNQAQMQNLQILDQQYGRQAEAKSKTKAQTLEALKSIASKTAQNKLENRQLGIMENMYNYRFGPKGQAINYNDPHQFNMQGNPTNVSGQSNVIESQGKKYRPIDYDNKTGQPTKFELVSKNGAKVKARNGSIVKALKTL